MRKGLSFTLCLLLLFITNCCTAQNEEHAADSTDRGLFEKVYSTSKTIGVNPVLLLNGDYALFFERTFSQRACYEIALGLTTEDQVLRTNNITETNNYKSLLGYSLRMGVKFYIPYKPAHHGWYGGIGLMHRLYRLSIDGCTSGIDFGKNYTNRRFDNDLKVSIGYKLHLLQYITVDAFLGMSLRLNKYILNQCYRQGSIQIITESPQSGYHFRAMGDIGIKLSYAF